MAYESPIPKVERFIRRFIVLPNESDYTIFSLWIGHTYFMDKLNTTPRLAIISPEFGCGKSRCIEVLASLCFKGEKLDHHTRSYLMRTVENCWKDLGKPPTLLLDEIDTVFRGKTTEESEATRAFANTGYRSSGYYGITEGDKNKTPVKFRTFAPMALAGKGEVIPDSVMTRAIIVRLQMRMAHEVIEDFLENSVEFEAQELSEELSNWSDYCREDINQIQPDLTIRDREREIWLPLFKVAHLVGEEWVKRIEIALGNIQAESSDNSLSRERQLLADIWKVFQRHETDRVKSSVIVLSLTEMPESEWDTYNFGKPITEKTLAKKLRTYGIRSKQMRFENGQGAKGYYRSEVYSAVRRYLDPSLPPETPETPETQLTPMLEFVSPVSLVSLPTAHN